MNIANLLARAGRAHADRPAVVVGATGSPITARSCDASPRSPAVSARGSGWSRGERVALVMRNCAAYVEALFACWQGGFVAVPVNAKLHPREIAFILAHSGARVCFATGDLADAVAYRTASSPICAPSSPSRTPTMRLSPRSNRRRSRAALRRIRPGCSTRAAPPAAPRARCSAIATCWR